MWIRNYLLILIAGILIFLLAAAQVADLGGEPLDKWLNLNEILAAGHDLFQGNFGAALTHAQEGVAMGWYTFFFMVLILAFTIIQLSLRRKKKHAPSSPAAPEDTGTFRKLRAGNLNELVGRRKDLNWLKKNLLDDPKTNYVAVASVQGAGGMGKTYLAQVFALENREQRKHFVEIYMGERQTAFGAGLELLERFGVESSNIPTGNITLLSQTLQEQVYSQDDGILILDDVADPNIRNCFPNNKNWSVIVTTRDLDLARQLTENKVLELDVFTPNECIRLFKKVLGNKYLPKWGADYQALAEFLGRRPYGIRLAAESLRWSISDDSPQVLLKKLQNEGLPSPVPESKRGNYDVHQLKSLLEHCMTQLKTRSEFSHELLLRLAACSDEGLELRYFLEWQNKEDITIEQVEDELFHAQDFSLLLVEDSESEFLGKVTTERKLRLHNDVLVFLREQYGIKEQHKSLMDYITLTLIENPENIKDHRSLQKQIIFCFEKASNWETAKDLYFNFYEHLYYTARLQWAFEMSEKMIEFPEFSKQLIHQAGILGNQATIFQNWGNLAQAMALHKKEEEIYERLNNRSGLMRTYGNQAIILKEQNFFSEAMKLFQKQEGICEQLDDRKGLASCYANRAVLLEKLKKYNEAIDLHKKTENICKQLNDKIGLAICYMNKGNLLGILGDLNNANTRFQQAENIMKSHGNTHHLMPLYWNQGLLLRQLNEHSQAIEKFNASIFLQKQLKSPRLKKDQQYLTDYIQEQES